ncbi:hypothetical protein DFH09DRAFT_1083557 [Mycena vulgaris]|nr:hypothetical protein DFH09DRAFT_1083557 [Mycena vulgaris]
MIDLTYLALVLCLLATNFTRLREGFLSLYRFLLGTRNPELVLYFDRQVCLLDASHASRRPAIISLFFRRSWSRSSRNWSVSRKQKGGDVEGETPGRAAEVVGGKKPAKRAKKAQGIPVTASTTTKTRKLQSGTMV